MEQYYICEELPLAIQYGMTLEQFWNEDESLFFAFQKAYINKTHQEAHINALYINLAITNAMANMMRKKEDKLIEFPDYDVFNPFNDKNTKKEQKSIIRQIDCTKNNNDLFNLKKIMERRKD